MFSTFKGAARVALAATIFSALGLTASAQTLKFNTVTTATNAPLAVTSTSQCMAYNATMQTIDFVPGTATFTRWIIEGDIAYETGYSSASNPTIKIKSQALNANSTQYGKGRVSVEYYYNVQNGNLQCNGVDILCNGNPIPNNTRTYGRVSFDIFKSFTAWPTPNDIVGPTCWTEGEVTYSVQPVVSKEGEIQSGIGTDTYYWQVILTNATTSTTTDISLTLTYNSGDKSSITFTPAAGTTSYTVKEITGQCNKGTAGAAAPNWTMSPATTALRSRTATASALINKEVQSQTTFPSCLPLTTPGTFSSTSFTMSTTTSGVRYDITGPAGWLISPTTFNGGASQTISISNIDNNAGTLNISGTATTNTCYGNQLTTRRITRQVVAGTPTAPINVLSAGCFTASIAGNVSLSNAPIGSTLTWTVPAGFTTPNPLGGTITGGAGVTVTKTVTASPATLSLTSLAAGNSGTVSVTSDGCAASTTNPVAAFTVRTNATTACYSIFNSMDDPINPTCRQYVAARGTTSPCNTLSRSYNTYVWRLYSVASSGTGAESQIGSTITYAPVLNPDGTVLSAAPTTVIFPYTVDVQYARVRLTLTNSNLCISGEYVWDGYYEGDCIFRPAPHPGGPGPVKGDAQPAQLRAYPNPTGNVLHVDLGAEAKGPAKLTILDVTGRVQLTGKAEKGQAALNVRALPDGTYSLKAETAEGKVLTKTVVVRH